MPLTYFNCPDGITRSIKICFEICGRCEGRCLSLPTLYEIADRRVWNGKPSTTQLLNPTRLEYLKIVKNYAIEPESMAFALLGTRHHQRLEAIANKLNLNSEMFLSNDELTGILDLLEPDELCNGQYKLIDYKTWGSYKVAKIQSANGDRDKYETALQLNNYRVMVEPLGFPISRMLVQATVRDGGTRMAKDNGVEKNIVIIPIDRLDDDKVKEYFDAKRTALIHAVESNEMPELCEFNER